MDQLHCRLAATALAEASALGFCLAGGYAVQAHGSLIRPSEDVDLLATTDAEERFSDALAAVVNAYEADRLDVGIRLVGRRPAAGGQFHTGHFGLATARGTG